MSLIQRQPSEAQSAASRTNSLLSTGPHTPRGHDAAARNGFAAGWNAPVKTLYMEALGEDPDAFLRLQSDLNAAMAPRDEWERAWVQDIAVLRWRLFRLQRAEAGALAARRREGSTTRGSEALPATGLRAMGERMQIPIVGFTGLKNSPWKFQQVLRILHQLRDMIRASCLDKDGGVYFDLLYGKSTSPHGAVMRARFETLSKRFTQGAFKEGGEEQIALLEDLNLEIENYQRQQAHYEANHPAVDPVLQDADLLLPEDKMGQVIRYETHLEDQIERKLRQFYARRREPAPPALPTGEAEPEKQGM